MAVNSLCQRKIMKYKNVIAIDLSKTSPGISTYSGDRIDIYFFNHRKRLTSFTYEDIYFKFHNIDFTSYKDTKNRFMIYDMIINVLVDIISKMKGSIYVGIEDYAYGKIDGSSRSVTDLSELKGIVMYQLHLIKNVTTKEIPIGSWKKWIYKGNSGKKVIYDIICNHFDIDMLEIFKLKLCKNGELPKPLDDIADSLGILMYMLEIKPKPFDSIGNIFG